MHLLARYFSVISALVALGAPASSETIVFSNLVQPGNQYGPDGVGIGHTPAFQNAGDYLIYAVPFTPAVTAALTSFKAPLGVVSGANQLQAFLMSDAGGSPAGIMESFALSGLPSADSLLTIQSALRPVVWAGHQYWFGATGGAETFGTWTLNLFQGDPADGGASKLVLNGMPGDWIVGSGSRTGALQVSGNPVPEPSYAMLLSCIVAAIGLRHLASGRRRHRCGASSAALSDGVCRFRPDHPPSGKS